MSDWFVYLLRCNDGTFYTGITTDVERRVREHNEGAKGARYTRARRPVELVYQECCESRSQAARREYTVRKLPHATKRSMAQAEEH